LATEAEARAGELGAKRRNPPKATLTWRKLKEFVPGRNFLFIFFLE
jgi:hypothetical protein